MFIAVLLFLFGCLIACVLSALLIALVFGSKQGAMVQL